MPRRRVIGQRKNSAGSEVPDQNCWLNCQYILMVDGKNLLQESNRIQRAGDPGSTFW